MLTQTNCRWDDLNAARKLVKKNMLNCIPHGVPPEKPTQGCFKVQPRDVVEVREPFSFAS